MSGALLFAKALPACQNPTGSAPTGPVSAGNVSSLKMNTLQVLSSNVVIGRDNQGLYAMSAVCPHAGCLVEDTSGSISAGLSCPCHGSAFDGNGGVTRGPARSSLQHYKVTIAADGSITVDGGTTVAADVRVPVPTG
jgi:cytochrome b6-f complex iron-sulfur subunit